MAEGLVAQRSNVAGVMPTTLSPGASGSAALAEGENVNQNFTNCSINVVVGDQIHANKIVYNIMSANGEVNPKNQERCSVLVNIINANTRRMTADAILDNFKTERLHRPDFKVNPRMRKIDVDDYFKGNYEDVEEMEVTIEKSTWFRGKTKKVLKNQLRKEIGFHQHEVQPEDALTLEQILVSITEESKSSHCEESSIIGIVASAGSGKTTLLRRLARRSIDITSITHEGSNQVGSKLIHFIELKTIHYVDSVKPSTFLFGGLFENDADEQNAYRWLLNNQTQAVLFFDGLDQATWMIDNTKTYNKMNPFAPADTATIMYNILSGNLLSQAKIVFTSREYKLSELPAEAWPTDIITLSGLSLADAKKLFVFLIGKDGAQTWGNIRIISPRLLNILCVPVFLILTAVVMSRDPTRPPPTTVTELYKRIIAALRFVDNIRQRDKINEIIMKLKAMAYRGMKEGRVVFYKEDIQKFSVSMDEVQDLIMKVPGNNLISRHLIEGDFIFFFCHQSIQEFLAASFIAHMTFRHFTQFVEKQLREKRWSVVRRFVFGLVYRSDDLHKISDQTKKQQVLTRSILAQLKNKTGWDNSCIRMELYTAIHESSDDDLIKELSVIDVSHISLSRDDSHIIGSLAARNKGLDSLILTRCDIDEECLETIARCLKDNIHVKEVDLSGNNLTATAICSFIGHRKIESLSGNLEWEVVMLTEGRWSLELKNKQDVIEISSGYFVGKFKIEESTLVFGHIQSLAPVVICGRLFGAEFFELNEQQQLLAKQDDLLELPKSKLKKMSRILLDCTEEKNIDWSLIETFLEKYQVNLLDIAVNGQTFADEYNIISDRGRRLSVDGEIHALFYIEEGDDLREIDIVCQQKKIEYIRCIFANECRASLDDILSLVSNSNTKKVTLLYGYEGIMLRADELAELQKIANDLDTELDVTYPLRRVSDAWERLDREFSFQRAEDTKED